MLEDLETIIVTEEQIAARIQEMGETINEFFGDQDVAVVAIINGALIFTADLIRHLRLNLRLDCIRVSSYRDETAPVTAPQVLDQIRLNLEGKAVLLIDDILDTGSTLSHVVNLLRQAHPASISTCVLLDKKGRRRVPFEADFVGFEIPDEFVVGYGLDFAERYRHLPCIGILKPELQNPPEWA
jgi:hypoxanthine phosphoribosyltransferase